MKVYLEFELPDEANDLQEALKAPKYARALRELARELRNLNKYGPPQIDQSHIEELRDTLRVYVGRDLALFPDEDEEPE